MSTKDRIMLFPSRANHVAMKARIISANKGLSLLKRKRDALELKLREIVAKRASVAENFNELFSNAIFSIAKAKFLDTDFKPAPIIGSDRADACMRLTYTKTIGLQLPTFEPVLRKSESLPLTGLSRGGKQVDVIRDNFQELLKTLILLASYDYSIRILNESIRANNMRLNGLEYVVIPRFNNTAAYISEELDELEREEFYRLKRSQAKQRAIKEKEKKAKMLEMQAEEAEEDEELMNSDSLFQERKSIKSKIVPIPISIYMKKKSASAAQTIITGHFPGSQELISPTDSIVSGPIPTVSKRSSFNIFNLELMVPRSSDAQPTAQQAPAMRSSIAGMKPIKRVSVIEQKAQPVLLEKCSDHFMTPESTSGTSKQASIADFADFPINDVDVKIKVEPKSDTDLVDTVNASSTVSAAATPSAPNNTADPSVVSSIAPLIQPGLTSSGAETSAGTSSALIHSQKYTDPVSSAAPSAAFIPSSTIKTESNVLETGTQTDITGRYPRSSEMQNPFFTGISDTENAESQTMVSGRRGRYSNTDNPDGVHNSEAENEQNSRK